MNNYNNKIAVFIFLILLPGIGCAAEGDLAALITSLQNSFSESVRDWVEPLSSVATRLLLILSAISLSWTLVILVSKNADIQEISAVLIRNVMIISFFLWLIADYNDITQKLSDGFVWIAGSATGQPFSLNASEIFERGFSIAAVVWDKSGITTLVPFGIACIVIVFLYTLIATQMFFVIAEMHFVVATGVILLGFGGNQWTGGYSINVLKYLFAKGMAMYTMFLVVGAGDKFINDWVQSLDVAVFADTLALVGVLLMFMVLVKQVPDAVGALVSGAAIGQSTPSVGGMAKTAAKVVGGAGLGAAGAGMAMSEAAKAASADGKTAADNRAGAGISSQLGKFDSAVEFGANMAGHLGASAGRVTAGKLSGGFKSSGGTLGGSMAHDIRKARQSTKQGQIELAAEKARESMAGAGSTEAVADLVGDFTGGGITGGGISGGSPADSSGSELAGNDDSQHSGRTTDNADPGVKSGVISPALQAKVDGMSEGDQEKFQQVKAMADKGEGVSYPSRQWLQEKGIAVSELYDTGEGRKKTPQQGFQMQRVSSDDSDQLLQERHRQGVSPAKQSAGMGGAADKPIGSMAGGAIAMDDAVDMPAAEQGTGFVPEDYDDYAELAGADLAPPDIDYMDSGLNEPPPLDDGWFDALDDDSHSKPKAEDHSNRE